MSVSLELLGDRWSLLIVRDMMVRGYRKFREFQRAGEGIATNILSDRLRKLESAGIVLKEPADKDGRSLYYRLTEKGIALAPQLSRYSQKESASSAPSSFSMRRAARSTSSMSPCR